MPPPATLLDAGCGTGQYATMLQARGYRVVGADSGRCLLRAYSGAPAAAFVLADLPRLPFGAWFDVVLARGVLNDLLDPADLADALRSVASVLATKGRFIADVREREAHRSRVARQPVVERRSGAVTFRASRSMDERGIITSLEQFAREGVGLEPYEFRMRTFKEREVRSLWQEAGLEVLSVGRSYGPTSRLADRLVVVAGRARTGTT